jgi:hypothetical protein
MRSIILPNWEQILKVAPRMTLPVEDLESELEPELESEPEPVPEPEPVRPPKTAKDPLGTHHAFMEDARAYLRGLVGPNRK